MLKKGDKVKLNNIENIGEYAPHLKIGDVGIIVCTLFTSQVFIVDFENIGPGFRSDYAFEAFELESASLLKLVK